MPRLRLSLDVSWHVRGDTIFAWNKFTGEPCAMSRDVAALCLAFAGGADVEELALASTAGLSPGQVREFAQRLAASLILQDVAQGENNWALYRPYVPRLTVYERQGADVVVYGRDSATLHLKRAADFLARADGARLLGELAPHKLWPELLRLCQADFAALKLLSPCGAGLPRWAESTMPWPERELSRIVAGEAAEPDPANLAAYHKHIAAAAEQFDDTETTLSHLFREPHAALGGESFGARLAKTLIERGLTKPAARVVEVGGGLGFVAQELTSALEPANYLIVDRSPALSRAQRSKGLSSLVGDATHLPLAAASVDLLIANEMAGDLGTADGVNHGALALIDECARVLAPGGVAYVSEFGHPTAPPRKSDHLDHDEYSLCFADLAARAQVRGLTSEIVPLTQLIGLDPKPLALITTRASFAALRQLFHAHGRNFAKRAWLADEVIAHAHSAGLDSDHINGLAYSPIGKRTMGLAPGEFWALLMRKEP